MGTKLWKVWESNGTSPPEWLIKMCNGTILLSLFYFTDSYLYQLRPQDLPSPVLAGICDQGLSSLTNGVHFGVSALLLVWTLLMRTHVVCARVDVVANRLGIFLFLVSSFHVLFFKNSILSKNKKIDLNFFFLNVPPPNEKNPPAKQFIFS